MGWVYELCEYKRLQRTNPICKLSRTRRTKRPAPQRWRYQTRWWCVTFHTTTPSHAMQHMYSNIIKKYANWNVCFSCGFDVEDGHTSKTCPVLWRRANHQEDFDQNNAGQYIEGGYNACTKAMHKSQLPSM